LLIKLERLDVIIVVLFKIIYYYNNIQIRIASLITKQEQNNISLICEDINTHMKYNVLIIDLDLDGIESSSCI